MFAQITKGLSQNIEQALAKHAPQNLGQNLSHQNLTKPAQNLANSITQNKANQSLAPQAQTRQALTRFGNELAQNPQSKPTQAVFDFDFIARDKSPELPKSTQAQADNAITPPASAAQADSKISPASAEGFPHNSPSRAEGDTGGGLFDLPSTPQTPKSHTPQSQAQSQTQNLTPHTPTQTPQSHTQSLQARYDTLRDFASKTSQAQRELTQEAKSLYDSFAKSLESLNQESLSAKELNATDRHLSEYLLHSELAQVPSAKDIVLPYFSAKYQAKSEAELAQTFGSDKLAQMRQALQESKNTNPLSEFGTNYAEFYQDGKGAIAKLISEANAAKQAGQDFSGQVAGAFSKEIDGAPARIDLVWGQITNAQTHEGYGLAHIIDKHPELDLNLIPQIIERGKVESKNGIHSVILEQEGKEYRIGLGKGWKGNGENEWIITAYENKNIKENGETFYHDTFTTKEPLENLDNEIIQKSAQKIQEKMKVSKEYAENLAKWHKDSHPITKEADGTPKVFYHGNKDNEIDFEIFTPNKNSDTSTPAVFFSADKDVAKSYVRGIKDSDKQTFEVFLNVKNPLVIDFEGRNYIDKSELADKIFKGEMWFDLAINKALKNGEYDGLIFKNVRDDRHGGGKITSDTIAVFNPNQIKGISNKGTFDATNPNIYHSSSTASGGVLGGTIAGVERDEEGNIVGFSPEKFALGFASGASAAKALSKVFQHKATQNHALKSIKILQKEYQTLQEHNLPLFAKIMSDIPPQIFIKPTKEAKKLSSEIFNKELTQAIQNAINKDSIKELPQANFKNLSDFRGLFDRTKNNIGYLATPIGEIRVNTQYALHHFTNNTYYKDRTNIKGGFFETFKNPLFIIEDNTKGKGSIYFYKPFYDKDKNMLNLFGIGVNQKGIINFKTYYLDEKKSRLKQLLKNEEVRIKYVAKE